MPLPKYKQRCGVCKKTMVVIYSSRQFPICVECHLKRIDEKVTDKRYKEMFDIPHDFYERSQFLRSIKESFLRFENLSDKQVEAFIKVVAEMKKDLGQDKDSGEKKESKKK